MRGIDISAEQRAAAEPPATLVAAIEDDLNSPKALAEFFALAKELNKSTDDATRQQLAAAMYASGEIMGLLQSNPDDWFAGEVEGEISVAEIEALIGKRKEARAAKDFAAADGFRDQLVEAGIQIEDSAGGTIWKRGG